MRLFSALFYRWGLLAVQIAWLHLAGFPLVDSVPMGRTKNKNANPVCCNDQQQSQGICPGGMHTMIAILFQTKDKIQKIASLS